MLFQRPFVKRFAICYRTVVLSVCLSVCSNGVLNTPTTISLCGQTVGRIKMKLGTEVDLSPDHIVLDGDQAPPKGAQLPIFGPCPL